MSTQIPICVACEKKRFDLYQIDALQDEWLCEDCLDATVLTHMMLTDGEQE
jgi:hypothetical protein